jgi:hypothetical protein
MSTLQTFQNDHRFCRIGEYLLTATGAIQRVADVQITDRLPLVYAIFSEDEPRYIGKTVQGYSRPLGYHKNDVMTGVRDGIAAELRAGRSVTVWVRTEQLHTDYEGLRLNLIDAIEMALIKKYLPPWNNQVHED